MPRITAAHGITVLVLVSVIVVVGTAVTGSVETQFTERQAGLESRATDVYGDEYEIVASDNRSSF